MTQHTDDMREAFDIIAKRKQWDNDTKQSKKHAFDLGYQAATASAEAKYIGVIEKLAAMPSGGEFVAGSREAILNDMIHEACALLKEDK